MHSIVLEMSAEIDAIHSSRNDLTPILRRPVQPAPAEIHYFG